MSITSLSKVYSGEEVSFNAHRGLLTGIKNNPDRQAVVVLVDPRTDLPTSTAFNQSELKPAVTQLNNVIATVHRSNTNLTEAEKTLLRWHYRFGHLSMRRVQFILRTGMLAHTGATRSLHTAAAKIVECPKCAACQYGKQCRLPVKGKKVSMDRDNKGATTKDVHLPGQRVAVDHFVCSTRGRLFTSRGKEAEKDKYMGGCIFVDLATGFIHIEFLTSLTSHETLLAKEKYEMMCRNHGVIVQEYVTDMGAAFTSKAFTQHLEKFEQVIRFAGAGGHHHNAQAERAIRTVTCIGRTMLFHQAIHWAEVSDPVQWPFALKHAEFLVNHIPQQQTGHSAYDLFTKTKWPVSRLQDLHPWGCPAYVLDKRLADGQKIPRFQPRSTRMVYMGISPTHASTVPMILNPLTGAIKAVFHVVFDDWFNTVTANSDALPDFQTPEWTQTFGDSEFQYPIDEDEDPDGPESPPPLHNVARESRVRQAMDATAPDPSSII